MRDPAQRCENCHFYWAGRALCRRFPPVIMKDPAYENRVKIDPAAEPFLSVLPGVELDHWCGEWRDTEHPTI